MLEILFSLGWLMALVGGRRQTARAPRRETIILRLEPLEDRVMPATFYWTGADPDSNSWNEPKNWSVVGKAAGPLPGPNDTVVFDGDKLALNAKGDPLNPNATLSATGTTTIGQLQIRAHASKFLCSASRFDDLDDVARI